MSEVQNRFGVLHRLILEGYEVSILHYDTQIVIALRNGAFSEKMMVNREEVKLGHVNIIEHRLLELEKKIKAYDF